MDQEYQGKESEKDEIAQRRVCARRSDRSGGAYPPPRETRRLRESEKHQDVERNPLGPEEVVVTSEAGNTIGAERENDPS